MKQPNVLFILTDQQRADTCGFRGLTPCRTPNIDRLASDGISFDRALTPCPLCLPARTALFTGRYPHQLGTLTNQSELRDDPVLLTALREHGYHVAYAGKWHMGKNNIARWTDVHAGDEESQYTQWCLDRNLPDGWAFNDPAMRVEREGKRASSPATASIDLAPHQTNEAWIADHAINLLRRRPAGRPFALVCSFNGPHPPFKIPEPYFSMYDSECVEEPANFKPGKGEPAGYRSSFYRRIWQEHGEQWDAWRKTVTTYWGYVSLVDAQIGRVLAELEATGELDRTLVAFASDHGEMLGQHGLWQKFHAYEEALRVPLVLRAPWLVPSGVRSDAPVSLIDLPQTVLAVCGITAPQDLLGSDLCHWLSRPCAKPERVLFSEHKPLGAFHRIPEWRMATNNHLKYVWNRGDDDELYHLQRDPRELNNLLPGTPDAAQPLRSAMLQWMQQTSDPLLSEFESSLDILRGRLK